MPKTRIVVTDAQVEAARMIVARDKATGRKTSEAIRKIAEAVPRVASDTGGQGK
jgi:translation elongation factor EF-4